MGPFPFREALKIFRGEISNGIKGGVDEADLEAFVELFAADFDHMLSHEQGEARWRKDGPRVKELGRYLGTFADFFASSATPKRPVRTPDLKEALAIIKPRCTLPEPEGQQRREYCKSVPIP